MGQIHERRNHFIERLVLGGKTRDFGDVNRRRRREESLTEKPISKIKTSLVTSTPTKITTTRRRQDAMVCGRGFQPRCGWLISGCPGGRSHAQFGAAECHDNFRQSHASADTPPKQASAQYRFPMIQLKKKFSQSRLLIPSKELCRR
jgi:hypothetical protein